jgi:Family of unknown function (DUF6152)
MLIISKMILGAGLAAAWLHHGWADYDTDRAFTLEGTIQKVQYVNPHVLVQVQPMADTTMSWLAVLAPPSRMTRRGLPQDSVRVGLTARLYGYPHREHSDEMRAERITMGGRTTELR